MAGLKSYAALWCKSNFSFLEGASSPEELVRQAADCGLKALAITDRDGVYGAVRAHVEAKKLGVKLIHGSQMTVGEKDTAILLVRSEEGYRNLCRLITAGRLRSPKGESRVEWEEVCGASRGLTALVPADREAPWALLKEAFGNHLYTAYIKHHLFEDAEERRLAREIVRNRRVFAVALPEVLYHHPDRRPLQDVLTCIRHKTTLEKAGGLLKSNDHYNLKAPEAFRELYNDAPQAMENTLRIAESCEFTLDDIHYTYPTETLPGGHNVMSWLKDLVEKGARKRYPDGVPEAVRTQIRREQGTIEQLEYGGYFLTMYEIVRFCREEGILCQGRGSAANSIVCYCLGITAVDPVQMDLLFERFLSLERAEPPDIDLDIEHQRREEVIQHMYRKYGRDRAAMVANIIRYRPKSAVRDVGKVLGFSTVDLERMARDLGTWWNGFEDNLKESLGMDDSELVAVTGADSADIGEGGVPRVQGEEPSDIDLLSNEAAPRPVIDRRQLLLWLSREILDFPRHLSIHPGGFILGSQPIAHLVPVENATMPDRTVIQWDKYDVEAMNLFKVDLLGLGALSHLDHTMKLLKKYRNIDVSLADISAAGDDPEVYTALQRSDTVGVFQVESRAQMAMLPRMKPSCFYDLVIEISIVRPGPISGGMVHPYLRRRNGEEPVVFPHPLLEPVLGKTLGVPIFQEQVMKLAVAVADYSPGEADQLRRDMAAWRSSTKLARHREKLITRMVAKGITPEFAEAVYSQIQGFGEYGFPESHAASFALIAYATAWFKVKHPAFFTCGLLNAWPMGFYSPATLVEDARRHDITILPVDITRSEWNCLPEWVSAAPEISELRGSEASPGGFGAGGSWGIRMGLRYVKGLNREQGRRVEEMKRRGADSVDEFAVLSGLDMGSMKALALSGAFVALADNRRSQLWHALGVGGRDGAARESPENGGPVGDWGYEVAEPLEFTPLSDSESVTWDYASSLHSTRGHPLEGLREELRKHRLPDSGEVRDLEDGSQCRYVGVVICRQRPGTANGVIFITLEDEVGFVNLVVWDKVYQKHRNLILSLTLLGVEGHVQSKKGTVHLIVERCFTPPVSLEAAGLSSRDFR